MAVIYYQLLDKLRAGTALTAAQKRVLKTAKAIKYTKIRNSP